MIALLAVLEISFEPAFVFPGERFTVVTSAPATVSSAMVSLNAHGDVWHGIGPRAPAEIYATIGPADAYTDAAMKVLPVAAGPPIGNIGGLQIVPMPAGVYGAILGKKRFPSLVNFSLAPRSAPERERPFEIDYVYIGENTATLSGDAGGLVRASVHITPGKVVVTCAARFHVTGRIYILGEGFQIASLPSTKTRFEVVIPGSAP